jgi:hypothetical protein
MARTAVHFTVVAALFAAAILIGGCRKDIHEAKGAAAPASTVAIVLP